MHFQAPAWPWRLDQLEALEIKGAKGQRTCEAGCYQCLLSYFNQPDHVHINRRDPDALRLLVALANAQVVKVSADTRQPPGAEPGTGPDLEPRAGPDIGPGADSGIAAGIDSGLDALAGVTVRTPSPQPSPTRGEGAGESAACAGEALLGLEGAERIPAGHDRLSAWLAALHTLGLQPPDATQVPVLGGQATAAGQYQGTRTLVFLEPLSDEKRHALIDKGWQALDFSHPEHWPALFRQHAAVFGDAHD